MWTPVLIFVFFLLSLFFEKCYFLFACHSLVMGYMIFPHRGMHRCPCMSFFQSMTTKMMSCRVNNAPKFQSFLFLFFYQRPWRAISPILCVTNSLIFLGYKMMAYTRIWINWFVPYNHSSIWPRKKTSHKWIKILDLLVSHNSSFLHKYFSCHRSMLRQKKKKKKRGKVLAILSWLVGWTHRQRLRTLP